MIGISHNKGKGEQKEMIKETKKEAYKLLYSITNDLYFDYINTFEDIENDEIIEEMKDTIKCMYCDCIGINRKDFDHYGILNAIINYFNIKTLLCINTPIPTNAIEMTKQTSKLRKLQAA